MNDQSDKKLISDFWEYKNRLEEKQKLLDNLLKSKDTIDESIFEPLREEYEKEISEIEPNFREINKKRMERVVELTPDKENLLQKIISIKKTINDNKILYKNGAILKENYQSRVSPLEKELKQEKINLNILNQHIQSLSDTASSNQKTSFTDSTKSKIDGVLKQLKPKKEGPIPNFESQDTTSGKGVETKPTQKSSLGKDFGRGFIFFIVLIFAVPIIGMALWTAKLMIIPIVFIIVAIIAIALFGKGLGFLGKIWR